MGDARGADRARGRLLRRPDLGPARHHPRHVRDRRVPGAGRASWSSTRAATTRCRCSPRNTRRTGFHGISGVIGGSVFTHPGVRRVRGRGAAGRGGPQPAPHHPAGGAAGHAADRRCCTCSPPTRSTSPSGPTGSPASRPGPARASWEGLARSLYGLFWFLVFLAIVNSTHRQLQRRGQRVQPDRVRDGPDRRVPARCSARSTPGTGRRSRPSCSAFVVTSAVMLGLGLALRPDDAFAMVGTGAGDRARRDLHPDERGLHRLLRPQRGRRLNLVLAPGHPDARASWRSCPPG